jgi:hypothetical protein
MSSKFLIGEGKGPPSRTNPLGQNRPTTPFPGRHGSNPTKSPNPNQALVPVQKITQAQMEDHRKRGLCYSCDAKWTRGHVCAVPKLFLIEAIQKEEEGDTAWAVPTEEDPGEFFLEEFTVIAPENLAECDYRDTESEDHEDCRLYSILSSCCSY